MFTKKIANAVLTMILNKFKLDKVLDYVEKPNELDLKVADLEMRVKSQSERIMKLEKKTKNMK
tara:strand:+ start:2794 stop:2982 length:189 start_codon:yes stop_codon:yes gene_type:complete